IKNVIAENKLRCPLPTGQMLATVNQQPKPVTLKTRKLNNGEDVMKYFSLVTLTATSAVWILLLVSSNPAQVPRTEKPADIVTVVTDVVVTWAQITRRDDQSPVRGLRIEDLLLREEGKQQPISLVKHDQPLSVVILVDGMRCVWPAAYEFVRARQAL